jgi:hypothetical protein
MKTPRIHLVKLVEALEATSPMSHQARVSSVPASSELSLSKSLVQLLLSKMLKSFLSFITPSRNILRWKPRPNNDHSSSFRRAEEVPKSTCSLGHCDDGDLSRNPISTAQPIEQILPNAPTPQSGFEAGDAITDEVPSLVRLHSPNILLQMLTHALSLISKV